MTVKEFITNNYKHFNAGELERAASALELHLYGGQKLMVTLAGAMSTAGLGHSLAEMIRRDKVHAICCTGANLEEDLFRLVAGDRYQPVYNHRNLSVYDEQEFLNEGLNRVTDVCIPEEEAISLIGGRLKDLWKKAWRPKLPHEYFYDLILSLEKYGDVRDSWLYEAARLSLPLYVPGWEDSTCGNIYVAEIARQELTGDEVLGGTAYMADLMQWYEKTQKHYDIAFLQIGGGIAGDFPISVVPLLNQELELDVSKWSYFCQISDSTTSYGSYSGAPPSEKITWGKLDAETPMYMIESDATIVAPLMFGYLLGW